MVAVSAVAVEVVAEGIRGSADSPLHDERGGVVLRKVSVGGKDCAQTDDYISHDPGRALASTERENVIREEGGLGIDLILDAGDTQIRRKARKCSSERAIGVGGVAANSVGAASSQPSIGEGIAGEDSRASGCLTQDEQRRGYGAEVQNSVKHGRTPPSRALENYKDSI